MRFAGLCILLSATMLPGWTQPPPIGIRDNSFLIEEGYNQERGVVQHILTHRTDWAAEGPDNAVTTFAFTQEWPVWGQMIQASYTVPLATQFEGADAHIRYQLMSEPRDQYSVAPRLSFLFDYDPDLSLENMLGYQVNLPISKEFDRRRAVHANVGATFEPPQAGYTDYWTGGNWVYNVGLSGIYALRNNLHAMAEVLSVSTENTTPSYVVNPGVRYAVDLDSGPQWVFGAGVPIGFTQRVNSYGLFLYLSLEHRFLGQ